MLKIDDSKLISFLDWIEDSHLDISKYLYEKEYQKMVESRYLNQSIELPNLSDGAIGFMTSISPNLSGFRDALVNNPEFIKRYHKKNVYKCMLLCNNANPIFSFGELLSKDVWNDLNTATGDFLDVFYVEDYKNKSGYQYIRDLRLNITMDQVPCIVLWKEFLDDFKVIKIKEFDKFDVVETIIKIASLASRFYTLEQIDCEMRNLRESIIVNKHQKNNVVINNSNSNVNDVSVDISLSVSVLYNTINDSSLSDTDKLVLKGMISEIQELKKTKDKNTIWEKVKSVLGWVVDKTADVVLGSAILQYLSKLI